MNYIWIRACPCLITRKERGKQMNKMGISYELVDRMEIPKKDAMGIIETVFDIITKALVDEGKVTVVGFGTFVVKNRKARRGVKPGTKEEIHIPPRKMPVFIPGTKLKAKVSVKKV